MSSTIIHDRESPYKIRGDDAGPRDPFLTALGERVRAARARKGMTRRALAESASVSDRHLANLEYGIGNPSVLVLLHVAQALQCSLAELLGDITTSNPEWLLIRELLGHADEATLHDSCAKTESG